MRRITLIIFILSLTLIMAACGKSIEEKIGEKITEKIIEDGSGGKVDIDGDTTTIKTDDGTTQYGSELEWPKDKMGNIPEIKANIIGISEDNTNKSIGITFDSFNEEDANEYVNKLKELGYSNGAETLSSEGITFSGSKDNTGVVLMYFDGSGTLAYMPEDGGVIGAINGQGNTQFTGDPVEITEAEEEPTDEEPIEEEPEEIDMTDDVAWPEGFINGLPELEGKIVGISTSGDSYLTIDLEYVEKDVVIDYIKAIKELGYSLDPTESMSGDHISYYGYNEKGGYIQVIWSNGNTYLELSKS